MRDRDEHEDFERERGSSRGINTYIVLFIALALTGVILYLLSELNQRRYFLVLKQGQLTVERGRMFPIGSAPYLPNDPKEAAIYAPLNVPANEHPLESQSFDSLPELNRQLFTILASWSRKGMESLSEEEFEAALLYIDRARKLPALSDEQQQELGSLRGDVAYRNGKRLVRIAVEDLQRALKSFYTVKDLGTTRPTDVNRWIAELELRIKSMPAAYTDANAPLPAPMPSLNTQGSLLSSDGASSSLLENPIPAQSTSSQSMTTTGQTAGGGEVH
jgi:hypothetical protein